MLVKWIAFKGTMMDYHGILLPHCWAISDPYHLFTAIDMIRVSMKQASLVVYIFWGVGILTSPQWLLLRQALLQAWPGQTI